jgi:hypothetical protein
MLSTGMDRPAVSSSAWLGGLAIISEMPLSRRAVRQPITNSNRMVGVIQNNTEPDKEYGDKKDVSAALRSKPILISIKYTVEKVPSEGYDAPSADKHPSVGTVRRKVYPRNTGDYGGNETHDKSDPVKDKSNHRFTMRCTVT